MHCKKIRSLLSLYLDKTISVEDSRVVEQHLQVCRHCQGELAAIRQLCLRLRTMEQPRMTKPLWLDIQKRLRQRRLIR